MADEKLFITKIKLGDGTVRYLKDDDARQLISDLETSVGEIQRDYLTSSDKTELQGNIDEKQDILGFQGDYNKSSNPVTTKKYVDDLVGALKTIEIKVVQNLPTAGESNIIYLVPKGEGKTGYKEYVWVASASKFEEIGDTDIDLSGYVTKTTKIAGVDLQDDITAAELRTGLNVADGATKVEATAKSGKIKINGTEVQVVADNTVTDANYKHISVTANSVSDGTTTFTKYDDTALAGRVAAIEGKEDDWDAKQDALAFDGTYDASTNKVATVSTVNDAVANYLPLSGGTLSGDLTIGNGTGTDDDRLNVGGLQITGSRGYGTIKVDAGLDIKSGTGQHPDYKVVIDGTSIPKNATLATTNDLHSHDNKTVLDGITSTKVSNWDTAYTNNHTHGNKTVLDGIKSTDITAWNGEIGAKAAAEAADAKAVAEKTRAEGVESTLSGKITALEGKEYEVTVDPKTVAVGGQTATVASKTVSGVKATGSVSGTASIGTTATNITLNGTFTPAGTVAVTLENAGVLSSVKSAGTLPTYKHEGFSGGSLGNASSSKFVKKTINAKIASDDAECLEFFEVANTDTSFYANALTAQGTFTPAAYGTDTFTQGAMPEFNTNTVGVKSATFTGTADQAIATSGTYDKVNASATISASNVSLSVGDIVVPSQSITTAAKSITVAEAGTYDVTVKAAA